jgi:hypothetical protein
MTDVLGEEIDTGAQFTWSGRITAGDRNMNGQRSRQGTVLENVCDVIYLRRWQNVSLQRNFRFGVVQDDGVEAIFLFQEVMLGKIV